MNQDGRTFLREVRQFLTKQMNAPKRELARRIRRLAKRNVISGFVDGGLLAAEQVMPKKLTKKIREFLDSAEKENIVHGIK